VKVIAIGRNYTEHARELNNPLPTEPVFFMKPDTAIVKGDKAFFLPDFSQEIHHEVEIVLKISKMGKNVSEKFAPRYFSEIGIGIDFTARDLQAKCKEKGLPWEIAKAFDNSAPVGQFLPKSEFSDLGNINFRLDINGTTVQKGNTGEMIFGFNRLIQHVSRFVTIKIGDLLFTGTPAGVGPVRIGDHLQAYIEDKCLLDFYVK
jgi:2-keto-4-pentenoate hydratase/2-oxohepta-3-ene-1,7-dioic acid hydratase in catechol pathway